MAPQLGVFFREALQLRGRVRLVLSAFGLRIEYSVFKVSVFSLKTYASFRPSAPPAAFGDRAGQPPRVPDGRAARYLAVKRKR